MSDKPDNYPYQIAKKHIADRRFVTVVIDLRAPVILHDNWNSRIVWMNDVPGWNQRRRDEAQAWINRKNRNKESQA